MGRYLVTCCLAVLLILVQFDLSLSGRNGNSRRISKGRNPGLRAWPYSQIQPRISRTQPNPPQTRTNSPSLDNFYLTWSNLVRIQQNHERTLRHPPYNARNLQILGQPQNPGNGGGGNSLDHYDSKPWKPKPSKHKMKHMAAVGDRGGYALGSELSYMHFRLNNRNEKRWWYENRNRYSDRVYYRKYDQPISKDVFVRDCVNVTVKEYIEPTGNQTEDEMEMRVVTQVVHEMCIEQYRLQSSEAEGGNSKRPLWSDVAGILACLSVSLFILTLASCFLIHRGCPS